MGLCAKEGCADHTVGNSRYCSAHLEEAHIGWRDRIRAEQEERKAREAAFQTLFDKARKTGAEIGAAMTPTPMVVQQRQNMADDSSPVAKEWLVPDGVCGFAWVTIKPGTCRFARWLVKRKLASNAYYGGVEIWIPDHNQSYERKMAHARAMAEVLRLGLEEMGETGRAFAGGRLD